MQAVVAVVASLAIGVALAHADDAPPSLSGPRATAATRDQLSSESLAIGSQPDTTKNRIKELIAQLGDPRYTTRRAAATELRHIGAEAFDLLHAATADSDPEVAASSRYLLRQIAVRWVQSEDPPAVRTILRDYDRKTDNARLSDIQELSQLTNSEGVAGLCRIARFDRSPVVSRMAALAVIRPARRPESPAPVDPDTIATELGESSRTAAIWLRHYQVQLRDPAASVELWQELVDDEVARLNENASDTSPKIASALLWNLADIHRQLDNRQAMFGVVDRMIGIDPDALESMAVELLTWLTEHESWEVLDDFLVKHLAQLEQTKRPLYYAAMARAAQGKIDEADQLAAKAALLDPQNDLESFIAARDLEEHGQFDWAVREYRRNIDPKRIASHEGILARIYLASLLHDYEKHGEAADVLEPLAKAVKNEGQIGQAYTDLHRFYRRRLNLPEADALSARLHYYRGLHYRDAGDHRRERDALELANKFDPSDPDVLIAMYRVQGADEKWLQPVRIKIRNLAAQVDQQIDENPNEPDGYNQWAWLISNTEGDFPKAIRYSHRSLELLPQGVSDSAGASFFDTLGRCYFAAGDVDNALKYQRQAVEKVDYIQVIQRQLKQFEKAAAEKEAARSQPTPGGTP